MPPASGSSELSDAVRVSFHFYEKSHTNYVGYNKRFLQKKMCKVCTFQLQEECEYVYSEDPFELKRKNIFP